MPSPFPGMEPYLEHPARWPGLHTVLVVEAMRLLQPQLAARGYYAAPGERQWVTLHIQRSVEEITEPFLEIFDVSGNRLITGIEFVSPKNKAAGPGRELYQRKQQELRDAGVHLVEIDLLRRGAHVVDVPESLVMTLPRWDYLVNLARRGAPDYQVYPIRIRDRLPRIRIPLKAGEADAGLDLQETLHAAYDDGAYEARLDYTADPTPPLAEDDAAWADQLLREKGLRS